MLRERAGPGRACGRLAGGKATSWWSRSRGAGLCGGRWQGLAGREGLRTAGDGSGDEPESESSAVSSSDERP